jgi:hypothetical protein
MLIEGTRGGTDIAVIADIGKTIGAETRRTAKFQTSEQQEDGGAIRCLTE